MSPALSGRAATRQGMHGAAFDAQLAIAKVASTSSYSFTWARQAADWGRQSDSVAVNVSAAYHRDRTLESSLVPVGVRQIIILMIPGATGRPGSMA